MPPDRPNDGRVEERDSLRLALARLTAPQRTVLVLRFFCDMSVEQTAQALGCATGTVKSQTSLALAAMRRRLASTESETT